MRPLDVRILQLSTHTTLVPHHGGKLRGHHFARVLEQEGFEIQRLAFCWRGADDVEDPREPIIDTGRMSFWGGKAYKAYGPGRSYIGDYLAAVGALQTPAILREFDNQIRTMAPDVISTPGRGRC
jgi:hypothetical protein